MNNLLQNQGTITIDGISQFYLAFRWTFQATIVDFGEVQKLAQACGVEFNIIQKGGFIEKKGSKITVLDTLNRRVINPEETCLVNIMHRSLIAWKEGNETQLEKLFSSNNTSNSCFWQFCQAVAECLPRKNVEKQLLEGLLVSKHSK